MSRAGWKWGVAALVVLVVLALLLAGWTWDDGVRGL